MARFPRHLENVKVARCADCERVQPLVAWWGNRMQYGVCMTCDNLRWESLLASVGRLAEWRVLIAH